MPSGAVLCTVILISNLVLLCPAVAEQYSEGQHQQKDSSLTPQHLHSASDQLLPDAIKNKAGSDGLHTPSKIKKKDKADPIDAPLKNISAITVSPAPALPGNSTLNATLSKEQNSTSAVTPVGPGGKVNPGSLLRGFYVFLGLSIIVMMYFIVRALRLNQTKARVHKYGVISDRDDLEMAHLEADDDENEVLFELPVK
ncbi:Hypothetical predicted protein [Cloeon dipterum]|uniref:Resistance to inhibitors of cholinesterase protein 3 N-terminal domain-containing protein n=1 Tax=Cloeon dipterum TaxID=197152 RepID=A0A8S1C8F3_9INSE|nr:Hypothetical predicted protein [Cloeon dipterum]